MRIRVPSTRLGAAVASLLLLCASPGLRAQETPYEVDLQGVEESELRELLEASSSLFRLREEPPPSPIGLERRADADRERMAAAMRSFGYYENRIDIDIDAAASPAQVDVAVTPGPLYRIDEVEATGPEGEPVPGLEVDRRELGLERGKPARARAVVDAEARLTAQLARVGYAFAKVADRRVVVDRADKTMDVTYRVDRGPAVRFGATRIEGLKDVDEIVVRRRIPWREGEPYDARLLEKARKDMSELGPFGGVRVQLAEAPGPEGVTPVTVTVDERPPRVVGFGFEYSSIDGLGANARWAHRNLFGGAESLEVRAEWSRIGAQVAAGEADESDFGLGVSFQKPDFLMRDQALLLDFDILREAPEAYVRDAVVLTGALRYEITDEITLGYGLLAEQSRVREAERRTVSTLLGVPLTFAWDGSNDLLNPTRGFRLGLEATPFTQIGGAGSDFLVGRWSTTGYHDMAADGNYVLAGRVVLGAIGGARVEDIPAHRRFYAGGGGSVRGYGYQKVGPRDPFGDPQGGLSLFEASLELRVKVTESVGVVPFLDAGNVYGTALPQFGEDLKYAAGLGLRYYTGFGPLRADVAVPLNREPGDDTWAFYLSIGQSF